MSQFDVHRNMGRNAAQIPFVVIVQSAAFDDRKRRIVVPLWASEKAREEVDIPVSRINPTFAVEGIQVILHPLQIVSVPVDTLGKKVASLADAGEAIIAALDEVFSRALG